MRHRYVIASTSTAGHFALVRLTTDDEGAVLTTGDRTRLVRLRDGLLRNESVPEVNRTIVGLGMLLPE